MKRLLIIISMLIGMVSSASAVDPADNGAWSSPETALQGFVALYAPVPPPAMVFYWFTYDENGNQVWFISENVPVNSGRSEDVVSIFKPLCSFVTQSRECSRGDPVGVLAISRSNGNLAVRFGIAPIAGFTESCSNLPVTPEPSPLPPPISAEDYPCQSKLFLRRVTPAIPELD